jgi:phage-related baseplate assembly protein
VDDTLPRGEGTVDVYIMGETGLPDPALIDAVQVVVDANRPITADALVLEPDLVTVDLTLTVTPKLGWDIVAMEAEIRRRFSVYFGDVEDETLSITPIGVGKDIVLAQLIAVVMGVSGVYSVAFSVPAADIEVDPNEFPESGTITITMAAASTE